MRRELRLLEQQPLMRVTLFRSPTILLRDRRNLKLSKNVLKRSFQIRSVLGSPNPRIIRGLSIKRQRPLFLLVGNLLFELNKFTF